MKTAMELLIPLLALGILLGAAFFVFAKVSADYRALGKLTRPVAWMQTGYFCAYALSSYLFLDSRIAHIGIAGMPLLAALLLMSASFAIVAVSMPLLGWQSFGGEVARLRTGGVYRYSRNPQLVGGFLFIAGYAMLWPSWQGAVWAALWLVISHLMVRAEEEHLRACFGDEYRAYCARTPRFIGCPRP